MKKMQKQTLKQFCKGGLIYTALLLSIPMFAVPPTTTNRSIDTSITQAFKKVSGIVKDVKGGPLPGVGVFVKGQKTGTITDLDGRYTLQCKEGDILVFTSLGFEPLELKVEHQTNIDVVLKEDSKLLDEVVVIGYGTSRKEDLSTAVTSLKIDKSLKSRSQNLGSVIQGLMPGVSLINNGGDPMSVASLQIRGRGSRGHDNDYTSGDGVLFVVDGVPGAPFNMEDVESITVLKDAASAAIYGASVGSGGVVVITTKQATEGKIKINVNLQRGFKSAWRLPKTLTSAEYNEVMATAYKDAGKAIPNEINPSIYPYGAQTRTDWINEVFRTGAVEHYAVSLNGGG